MGFRKIAKLSAKALKKGGVPPVAVVVSRYNAAITDRLLDGAVLEYASRGGRDADVLVIAAPGAFELPALALAAARTGEFAGVLALGCIIKGETIHDRVIADAVASGLIQVTIATGVPVALGVLTVDTVEQAEARSGGVGGAEDVGGEGSSNKGQEAMSALLHTIAGVTALALGERAVAAAGRSARAIPDKAAASRRRRGAAKTTAPQGSVSGKSQ